MNILPQVAALLRLELRTELRNPYTLGGIFLYVITAVVIAYVALSQFTEMVWNPIYWTLLFFAAISSTNRSFRQEQGRRQLYYYSLVSPEALLISKYVYNTIILMVLGVLLWGMMLLFGESNPLESPILFLQALALGSIGLSAAFSFVAAIATRAGGNATLMSILAFPLVIPLLILLVRLGAYALGFLEGAGAQETALLLVAVDLLLVAVGLILFPYVWRD